MPVFIAVSGFCRYRTVVHGVLCFQKGYCMPQVLAAAAGSVSQGAGETAILEASSMGDSRVSLARFRAAYAKWQSRA